MPQPPSSSGSVPLSRESSWRLRLPFFYGWVVVGSVFVNQAIAYGIYYSFTVFFVALLEEFQWNRGPTAGVFSVFQLVFGLTGPPIGAMVDRFGPARVASVGALLLALGLFATSQMSELWQFYLFFGVVSSLGVALAGWVPCVTVVNRWFSARRGVAMGIASAGIGLGIVVVVPFCQYLISGQGWRTAYLVLAALALFGIAPHAAFLQLGRPEELGLKPDGAMSEGAATPRPRARRIRELVVVDQRWASYPWSVTAALRSRRFWLLGGSISLVSATTQTLWAHQVAYLVDGGYDRMLAASMAGLAGLLSMPAKVLWGMAADRMGREKTTTVGSATMLLAILLLVLTGSLQHPWLLFLFAVVFAAGYAVSAPLGPASAADIFGGRNFGSIFGVLTIGTGVVAGLATWLAGYAFDLTGSYMIALAAAALSSCAGALCIWLAAPRKVRRVSWHEVPPTSE